MKLWPESSGSPLPIKNLVMPVVTRENVGELVADLLINSFSLQRVGTLESDYVLPAAGNDPYTCTPESIGSLTTSFELYSTPDGTFHTIQQRSPVALGAQEAFAADVVSWLKDNGITDVVLVCGLPPTYRHDPSQPLAVQYISNSDAAVQTCQDLGWQRLEENVEEEERTHHSLLPPWPLITALEDNSIAYTLVSLYADQGDNVPCAMLLAEQMLKLLSAKGVVAAGAPSTGLKQPCSWASVYGRPLDPSLYNV